jgi:hypothetical protein
VHLIVGLEILTAVTMKVTYSHVGCKAAWLGGEQTMWRNISPPSLGSKSKGSKKAEEARRKLRWDFSSTINLEAIYSSETTAYLRTTRR